MKTEKIQVNVVKTGNIINISLNGKLHKKSCASVKEADELIKLCILAKANPTNENLRNIKLFLNEKTRIAMKCGLEIDNDSGEIFLAGFNTPVPDTLVKIMEDYFENGYPMEAIINFWKLLMINPDTRVRQSLFDFIMEHDFVLTDSGYFIAYKAVDNQTGTMKPLTSTSPNATLTSFVTENYNKVKGWKKNPKGYMVYRNLSDVAGEFQMTKVSTCADWDEKGKGIQFMGLLSNLYNDVQNILSAVVHVDDETSTEKVFTDKYTHQMHIQLGVPVYQKRGECDANPGKECSKGLHVGATKYVQKWYSSKDSTTVLICYINPANVIAVPDHDKTKIRVCEYFPFAEAEYVDGKINIIKQSYCEQDYKAYEVEEVEKMVELVKVDQEPMAKCINSVNDIEQNLRPMSEYMKMLEDRLVVLST